MVETILNPAQPEGLQESSRWSESTETTGKVRHYDPHPGGVPDLTIDTSRQIRYRPRWALPQKCTDDGSRRHLIHTWLEPGGNKGEIKAETV